MSREGDEPDNTPPRSIGDPNEYRSTVSDRNGNGIVLYSPAPLSQKSDALLDLNNSLNYTKHNGNGAQPPPEDDGDIASDIQEGVRSEAGDAILPVAKSPQGYSTLNITN